MSSLNILDTNPLSDMWFTVFSAYSVGCLSLCWWFPSYWKHLVLYSPTCLFLLLLLLLFQYFASFNMMKFAHVMSRHQLQPSQRPFPASVLWSQRDPPSVGPWPGIWAASSFNYNMKLSSKHLHMHLYFLYFSTHKMYIYKYISHIFVSLEPISQSGVSRSNGMISLIIWAWLFKST